MSEALLSPSWYRVARLRPRIRSHARFHRHRYRGQLWYVLQDPSSGRCHRLSPAAYHIAAVMDGQRTVHEIWEAANTRLGDDGPTQDETLRLLGMLHCADLLQCDVSPDTAELFRRFERGERSEWWRRFANPLAVKIPLLDPATFLERWERVARPIFSWPGAIAWCAVVGLAAILAVVHRTELAAGVGSHLFDPQNLLRLWLVYPVVKALHELGHAFAARVWGGEVHEMGVMLLVLAPVPYVDASSSSAFPDKWKRAVVGAAGILVELFLAAIALFVWISVQPGLVRALAFDVMLIASLSTLLFNGNPLLRFDGYYVLADVIEIPNLGSRSTQYLGSLVLQRLFGLEHVRSPVMAPGEEKWFAGYAIASFVYRISVLLGIAVFISRRFFTLGVALALLAVTVQVIVPLVRHIEFVLTSPRLGDRRPRAIASSAGIALALATLLLLVPIPLSTRAEGVVWPPEGAQVRANQDGFVVQALAQPGAQVKAGDPLIQTRDASLETQAAVKEAELWELRARHQAEWGSDLVKAQITEDEIGAAEAALARARERTGEETIRSPADGTFVFPGAADLDGRFVHQGELVGYVVGASISTVRVVVPQEDEVLVRGRTRGLEVRLAGQLDRALPATIERQVPAATAQLPSRALGTTGGGRFPVDPADKDGLRTIEKVFQLDVVLPREAAVKEIGRRAFVRFDHGGEPVAMRAYRKLRRLFLRQMGA